MTSTIVRDAMHHGTSSHGFGRVHRNKRTRTRGLLFSGLPDSGFYPEISGFFEADGIFLGNFFLAKNLGKNLGNSQEKFT